MAKRVSKVPLTPPPGAPMNPLPPLEASRIRDAELLLRRVLQVEQAEDLSLLKHDVLAYLGS